MRTGQERRLLQLTIALACLVPLWAGISGAIFGPSMTQRSTLAPMPDLDSHFRYLSGLLFGTGIGFAVCIPTIERRSEAVATLCMAVVFGGFARLAALLILGAPSTPHLLAIGMELLVVPAIFLWQRRVAALCKLEQEHST